MINPHYITNPDLSPSFANDDTGAIIMNEMSMNRVFENAAVLLEYLRDALTPKALRPASLKAWFKKRTGRELNLSDPVTWCDKINWIKLYGVTHEMTRLSDKYLVREWIKEKIGEDYGEMTFTPSSGQCTWVPEGTDEKLGSMINLKS